jgi:shikimate kinase
VIAQRVTRSSHPRPKLLQSGQPLERSIADLMAARADAYAKAEVTIDTSDLTVEEVADRVIQAVTARAANRCETSE